MKYINAIIFLLLLQSTVFGQKNYKKAVLTTTNNEVINGFINDRESFRNPRVIKFKQSPESDYKKFVAGEVKSLVVENGNYLQGKAVELDPIGFDVEVDSRLDSAMFKPKKDTVLLIAETLSKQINLYFFNDNSRIHFYIEKSGEGLQELIYRRYFVKVNGQLFEKEENQYQEQLRKILGDCPSVYSKIAQTKYSGKSLSGLIDQYNKLCHTTDIVNYKKPSVKDKFEVSVFAGVANPVIETDIDATDPYLINVDLFSHKKLEAKSSVVVGGRFNYILPGRQNKMSLLTDAYYSQIKANVSEPSTFYSNKDLTIDISLIKLNLLFRYLLVGNKTIQPFINAGPSAGYVITNKSKVIYTNTNSTVTRDPFASGGLKKFVAGFAAGVGVKFNRVSVEYKYESLSAITNFQNYSASASPHHIAFVSYRLTK